MNSAGLALRLTKTSPEKATTVTRRVADTIVKLNQQRDSKGAELKKKRESTTHLLPDVPDSTNLGLLPELRLQHQLQLQVQRSSQCSLQMQHSKLVFISNYHRDQVVLLREPNTSPLLTQLLSAPARTSASAHHLESSPEADSDMSNRNPFK
jgi:hypothetical protein